MGVLLTAFCQALSAVLSQPEHPIINPFLPVTRRQSMSEQAIETAAINWAPVNPMGSSLGACQEEGVLGKPELGFSFSFL